MTDRSLLIVTGERSEIGPGWRRGADSCVTVVVTVALVDERGETRLPVLLARRGQEHHGPTVVAEAGERASP